MGSEKGRLEKKERKKPELVNTQYINIKQTNIYEIDFEVSNHRYIPTGGIIIATVWERCGRDIISNIRCGSEPRKYYKDLNYSSGKSTYEYPVYAYYKGIFSCRKVLIVTSCIFDHFQRKENEFRNNGYPPARETTP